MSCQFGRSQHSGQCGRWRCVRGVGAVFAIMLLVTACAQSLPESASRDPVNVQLDVDGQSHSLTTDSTTVRELLDEAGIDLGESDEVVPPLFTPLTDGLAISVERIREETDTTLRSIPFERKVVRNESMDSDDPPVIIQAGKPGLQEETVRIVYRDGLEAERWVTQVTLIEPTQDEIVMIGIGAARGNIAFRGIITYMSNGSAVIMRGLTAFPEQLNVGGRLDGRVFALSPTGSHLLYTRTAADTASFNNSLWVISTDRNAEPWALEVENVQWAGWNPDRVAPLQIAFTTAESTSLPPGWEANNDLWIGNLPQDRDESFDPEQLVETYPATYGWWGGNYSWSPTGQYIAYSFANEVGVIDMSANASAQRHAQLLSFTEYNTLLDWVWVPTLSWSPDGRFLAYTGHGSDDPDAMVFDSWVVDVTSGVSGRFVSQSGMWAHLHWAPSSNATSDTFGNDDQIAFLRSSDPLDSLRSSYTLWLMDADGSNARQVFPPPGENSYFPREQQFMAWSPDRSQIAFVFNNALYMFDVSTQEAGRITQDDAISSHPTWAPYGQGVNVEPPSPTVDRSSTPIPFEPDELLPEDSAE